MQDKTMTAAAYILVTMLAFVYYAILALAFRFFVQYMGYTLPGSIVDWAGVFVVLSRVFGADKGDTIMTMLLLVFLTILIYGH